MTTTQKKKRKWPYIILLSLVLIVCYFFFFLFSNEAPITQGEVFYGKEYKKGLTLDIYQPLQNKKEKNPVVIYLHGGAWITGTKESINFNRINGAVKNLRNDGYSVVSIEYTLANKSNNPFPDCIIDTYQATQWIIKHANQYHFDTTNIGLMGESAGAHIAMMLGYAKPQDFYNTSFAIQYRYIVNMYGPSQLEKLYQSETANLYNKQLEKLPEEFKPYFDLAHQIYGFDPKCDSVCAMDFNQKFSPINYINKNAPPTLFIHGTTDHIVPFAQSEMLATELQAKGIKHQFKFLEKVDHGFIGATDQQKKEIQQWIFDFITAQYKTTP